MRRSIIATAIQILIVPPLLSQAASNEPVALAAITVMTGASGLESSQLPASYQIHLASDWPQLTLAGTDCVNGGNETLSGTLSRTAGGYAGQLERKTSIRFCGTHGPLSPAPCSLTLSSRGPVTARAEVFRADGRPAVILRWAAEPSARDAILVEGNCAPAFNQSLKDLYLGVTHSLEFSLPEVGEAGVPVRLEDYGWVVAVW